MGGCCGVAANTGREEAYPGGAVYVGRAAPYPGGANAGAAYPGWASAGAANADGEANAGGAEGMDWAGNCWGLLSVAIWVMKLLLFAKSPNRGAK